MAAAALTSGPAATASETTLHKASVGTFITRDAAGARISVGEPSAQYYDDNLVTASHDIVCCLFRDSVLILLSYNTSEK
jgi:hypothetical protein